MKAFQLGLLLLLGNGLVHASTANYEVEIIVFEDTADQYEQSEHWPTPDTTEISTDAKTIKEAQPARLATAQELEWIPETDFRLVKEAQKLIQHPDYNVLLHVAWKQQGLDKDQAFSININSLTKELYKPVVMNPENTDSKKEPPQNELSVTAVDDQQVPSVSYIDGTVSLVMSRYLHFYTQLVFHKLKSSPEQVSGDVITSPFMDFPIDMERRMRSKEVHYIDHPMIGVIILATPYKEETEQAPDTRPGTYKTL